MLDTMRHANYNRDEGYSCPIWQVGNLRLIKIKSFSSGLTVGSGSRAQTSWSFVPLNLFHFLPLAELSQKVEGEAVTATMHRVR